jgi:hypothetical protein
LLAIAANSDDIADTAGGQRNGVMGDLGLRYTW